MIADKHSLLPVQEEPNIANPFYYAPGITPDDWSQLWNGPSGFESIGVYLHPAMRNKMTSSTSQQVQPEVFNDRHSQPFNYATLPPATNEFPIHMVLTLSLIFNR